MACWVPEAPTKIRVDDIKKILKRKSELYNFELPDNFDGLGIDYNKTYITPHLITKIEQMHQIAKERGGRCLSEHYTNKSTKLLWECSKGHQWEATPHNVIRGSWCMKCSAKKRAAKTRLF